MEAADDDFAIIVAVADSLEGNLGGFGLRITINTGADAGECDTTDALFFGKDKGCLVAGGQQGGFIALSVIDGTDRMDDVLAGQVVGTRYLALARLTTAEGDTLLKQTGTSSAMNSTIHTTSTQQGTVRCIDYSIDVQFCDISNKDYDIRFHSVIQNIKF